MRALLLILALGVLTSCAQSSLRPVAAPAEAMIAQNNWLGAIRYYQTELSRDPDNAELRRGYLAVAESAVEHFTSEARRFARLQDFSSAQLQLQQGLAVVPDSTLLRDELSRIDDLRRSRLVYRDAVASARLGRRTQAMNRVEAALSLDPDYEDALKLLARLNAEAANQQTVQPIRLRTSAPVTVNFRNAGFKEAALALGQAYGVNMIFDADLEDRPISLFAEDVTFAQAFELLLRSNRSFYRRLGKNSVVIAPDTPDGRAAYEDYLVRTFFLASMDAVNAADLISRSLGITNVTANESANSVTVRDSRERMALVAKLLDSNDRSPAEVVMEVEILEVNRTKSEQLGLDFGSQITITPPALTVGEFNSRGDVQAATNASVLSLPAATFRFFKQDVDAKTLASPRIRTLDKQEALIHIGDRVPLRSSTVQDATGQTRTTFEYRDIGIKLNVTPEINLDRTVLVYLDLEISSLGQNLGTADEPAFAIGTRNVSTQMVLDDTETAVIGGLIRDEDRDTRQRVPGLGDIPAVGQAFRSRDGSGTRTDILLTLTPRIIRGRDIPSQPEAEFFSGSGQRVTTETVMDFISSGGGAQPTIRLDLSGAGGSPALAGITPPGPESLPQAQTPPGGATGGDAALAFTRQVFEVGVQETVQTAITAAGFPDTTSGVATIRFRADLVEALEVNSANDLPVQIDNSRGEIKLTLTPDIAGSATSEIATISFRGLRPGLSYLIFSSDFGRGPNVQMPPDIELRASRIAVR